MDRSHVQPVSFKTVLIGSLLAIYFATFALLDLVEIGLLTPEMAKNTEYVLATLIVFFYHRRNTLAEQALRTPSDDR